MEVEEVWDGEGMDSDANARGTVRVSWSEWRSTGFY